MSEKKKINLSGLTKGNSSVYMSSFRFSPDSEAIEEIIQSPPSNSAPPSPKPGDSSPLKDAKEFFAKERHKWTNKWDKKSLSLDLDIKGKIKTAIEDKKKSILSNFIPEEGGTTPTAASSSSHLTSSQSIPEKLCVLPAEIEIAQDSSNSSGSRGSQDTLDEDYKKDVQSCNVEDVEEIGVDMTNVTNFMSPEDFSIIEQMTTFYIPPEDLREMFDGLPTLYQPISLISGVRLTPFELAAEDNEKSTLGATQSSAVTTGTQQQPSTSIFVLRQEELELFPQKEVKLTTVFYNILCDIFYHPGTKYWFALFAAATTLPFGVFAPFLWFILGCLSVIVISSGLSSIPRKQSDDNLSARKNEFIASAMEGRSKSGRTINMPLYSDLKLPVKSQGWMTQLDDGAYNPESCHFRQTRVVYVKIDGHLMYLSYPNQKHRIPKRRLWNDPVIDKPYVFDKINVYNISGAEVAIVPFGLVKKRVWNKKYPIAIIFPKHSVFHSIVPTVGEEDAETKRDSGAVNYNVNSADVVVKTENARPDIEEKEIHRQDCGGLSIYLFARCDREKDDWFRRFKHASSTGPEGKFYLEKKPVSPIIEYREYMKKIIPSMISPFGGNNPGVFDNVSLAGDNQETKKPKQSNNKGSGSASSSRKSTPDKDVSSDLENVLTVPQSPAFLNAFIGRLLYDFIKSSYGQNEIQTLIDKKLFFMKKPTFIEWIHVKSLDLGNAIPIILRASPPILDHQGLWIDLDIVYEGTFCVSLETRVNFLKLIKKQETELDSVAPPSAPEVISELTKSEGTSTVENLTNTARGSTAGVVGSGTSIDDGSAMFSSDLAQDGPRYSHMFDSEADDSGESSDDENEKDGELNSLMTYTPTGADVDPNNTSKGGKLYTLSQKIANSSFMNRPFVKKIVNNVASTPIILAVELNGCFGTLTVNIPGPPNDRIWLGFRTNPDVQLVVKPVKFGETNINISQVTEYIRRKLLLEFQRAMVCPNMVDISLPFMEFSLPQ